MFKQLIASISLISFAAAAIAQAPVVNNFFPLQAKSGDTITISGNNFAANTTGNKVFFGKIQGNVISATPTSLDVIVPIGPKRELINVLNVNTHLQGQSRSYFHQIFSPSTGSLQIGDFGPVQLRSFMTNATGYSGMSSSVLADFDNDGKLDLLIPKNQSRFLGAFWEVYRNTHQPGNPLNTNLFDVAFTQQTLNQAGISLAAGGEISKLIVKDINNDGKLDIVCGGMHNINQRDSLISINQSTVGNITFATPFGYNTYTTDTNFLLGAVEDIDGDGLPDFVGSRLSILRNTTTVANGFNLVPVSTSLGAQLPFNFDATQSEFVDFDGDGKIDIIGYLTNELIFFKNTSTVGNFSFATPIIYPLNNPTNANYQIRGLTIGDIDNDGKLDIVLGTQLMVTNAYTNITIVLRNNSVGNTFSFAPQIQLPSVNAYYSGGTFPQPSLKDLNGDGTLDIITRTDATLGGINFYANHFNGGVLNVNSFALPFRIDMQYTRSFDFGDIDGDGLPDIAGHRGSINSEYSIFLIKNIPIPIVNPNPASTCAHNDIDLTVFPSATVATPTAYGWQVSTGAGAPFTAVVDGAQYSGSNMGTLTIISPSASMDGYRYKCAVSAPAGFAFSTEAILNIEQLSSPIVTFNNPVLSVAGQYTSYQWYMNGSIIPGANAASYTVTAPGSYYVVVQEVKEGCTGQSIPFEVDSVTNIRTIVKNKWGVELYPNPVNDAMFIQNERAIPLQYTIKNMLGQLMSTGKTQEKQTEINTSMLPAGIYTIGFNNGLEQFNLKFIKN